MVSVLDPSTVAEVADVLRAEPTTNRYQTLKTAILNRLMDSEDRQLHTLLTRLELGDQKPSQLLRRMRNLAGDRVSDAVLRVKWLDLLPAFTRRLLTVLKGSSLEELAAAADELGDGGPEVTVAAARHAHQPSPTSAPGAAGDANALRPILEQLLQVTRENQVLLRKISTPPAEQCARSRGRSLSRPGRLGQSSRPVSPAPAGALTTCWYHRAFGPDAHQCKPPCSYTAAASVAQVQENQ